MRIAKQVLAGEIDANLGCGLIAGIGEKLNYPSELGMFMLLSHEQHGHEDLGISTTSCISDILEACRELLGAQA